MKSIKASDSIMDKKIYVTMDDAIREGKRRYKEIPSLGSEEDMIRYEVAHWLWQQLTIINQIEDMDSDLKLIEFMSRVTK